MDISRFEDDLFELSEFAARLETFINVEQHFVDGSLVLGLSSRFGTGKSTFFRMWKSELESREGKDEKPIVISLNAWASDYYGDPLFAIISSTVDCIQEQGKSANSLVEAAKDFGWFTTGILGQVVNKFTGIDPVAAGDHAEKKKEQRDDRRLIPSDAFSLYEGRKKAMGDLKHAIQEFVTNSESKILFLVDELDRCRPDYAISYIETIKHIFDVPGAVFILAADRNHLENSAKTAFGADLDFNEYYRKFIHREITLPRLSDSAYSRLGNSYVHHYLKKDGIRKCWMELGNHQIRNIIDLITGLRLTPRQIQETFRILGHILERPIDKEGQLL